jgi:hypothetical protein
MPAWKAYERWVANIFDTKRNPLSGGNNTGDDGNDRVGDIIHPLINVEAKNHKSMTVDNWVKKAEEESDKPVLLFCHKKNRAYDTSTVCMPYKDFLKIKDDYMRKVANEK